MGNTEKVFQNLNCFIELIYLIRENPRSELLRACLAVPLEHNGI